MVFRLSVNDRNALIPAIQSQEWDQIVPSVDRNVPSAGKDDSKNETPYINARARSSEQLLTTKEQPLPGAVAGEESDPATILRRENHAYRHIPSSFEELEALKAGNIK